LSFYDEFQKYSWDRIREEIYSRTEDDVQQALISRTPGPDELISLLSPRADHFLEELAMQAQQLTEQRFGRVVGLYAPLYLSSRCTNSCLYCSFNTGNPIKRLTLTPEQAENEGAYLRELGFRHVLLVSGEDRSTLGTDYFVEVVGRLRPYFDSISVEIYPMDCEEYGELARNGVDGLIIYQETYNKGRYAEVHKGGRKRDYRWRLETPERGGEAGFRRLGIGALLLEAVLADSDELSDAGAVAFSDDGHPLSDADLLLHALRYARCSTGEEPCPGQSSTRATGTT